MTNLVDRIPLKIRAISLSSISQCVAILGRLSLAFLMNMSMTEASR